MSASLAKTLKQTCDLNNLPSSHNLRKAALSFKESSFFSFISKDYRSATKLYRTVSMQRVEKKTKVEILEQLSQFKDLQTTFMNDAMVERLFEVSNIKDINFTEIDYLKSLLDNLDNLSFSQRRHPVFHHLVSNPQHFIELYDEYKFENYDFRSLELNTDSTISIFLQSKEETIKNLTKLTKIIDDNEIRNQSVKETFTLKNLHIKLEDLEKDFEQKIEKLNFINLVWLTGDDNHLIKHKEFIKQLIHYDQLIREEFLKNFSKLTSSEGFLDTIYEAFNSSLTFLIHASNLLDAEPINLEKKNEIELSQVYDFSEMHNKSGAINDYFDLLDAQDSLLEGPKAIRKFYDAITSIDNPKDFSGMFQSWLVKNQYDNLLEDPKNNRKLNKFKGTKLNKLTEKLKTLDVEVQNLMRKAVKARAFSQQESAPQGSGGKPKNKTEKQLLEHGVSLKNTPRGINQKSYCEKHKGIIFILTMLDGDTFQYIYLYSKRY